ncbi:hypothetical protein AWB79_01068 [Caballeronia hypogeia]|uniref:Uncharacterized protein n=2 Tax=Caballeronia hypogeia TaxID=1777140 RepID=A0A157ZM40_9BURK|nr:hypothetical protein AWB79_01068 [Caballeronia hypogeia]
MGDLGTVFGQAEDVARTRLHENVCRFVMSIAHSLGDDESDEIIASCSFDDVLISLHEHACAIGFGGMRELTEVIDTARVVADALTLEALDQALARLHARYVLEEGARTVCASAYLD